MPSFKKLKKSWIDTYKPERKHDDFYSSKGWRKVRDMVTKRDGNLCQICKTNGVITVVKKRPRDYAVDHIKPKRLFPDLYKDLNNLQTTCSKCHAIKSAKEQKYKNVNQWYADNT